jgi:hypothetical protein
LLWLPATVQEYRGTYRYGDEPVGVRAYRGLRWTGASAWVEDRDLNQALDWVSQQTQPSDILAHAQPGIFTFFTNRPSTRLPRALSPEQLRSFIQSYRVSYVLLNNYDGFRRRYQDELMALDNQGVTMTAVQEYRIFDTRPLWRSAASVGTLTPP